MGKFTHKQFIKKMRKEQPKFTIIGHKNKHGQQIQHPAIQGKKTERKKHKKEQSRLAKLRRRNGNL